MESESVAAPAAEPEPVSTRPHLEAQEPVQRLAVLLKRAMSVFWQLTNSHSQFQRELAMAMQVYC
jgi:hypothetical protein